MTTLFCVVSFLLGFLAKSVLGSYAEYERGRLDERAEWQRGMVAS